MLAQITWVSIYITIIIIKLIKIKNNKCFSENYKIRHTSPQSLSKYNHLPHIQLSNAFHSANYPMQFMMATANFTIRSSGIILVSEITIDMLTMDVDSLPGDLSCLLTTHLSCLITNSWNYKWWSQMFTKVLVLYYLKIRY